MTNERFSWSRADKVTAAFELKKRQVIRELTKDSELYCLVCEKRPRKHDSVYYPASGLPETNRVIAHTYCVDETCGQHHVKMTNEVVAKNHSDNAKKKVIPMPVMLPAELSAHELFSTFQKMLDEAYEAGKRARDAEILAELESFRQQNQRRA